MSNERKRLRPSSSLPHYFCKLWLPGATFLRDMTLDEAGLTRAHREFWAPRVETDVVVAMGPVADPAGAYGVMIIEAASREALEAMQASDLIIAARRGLAFENCLTPAIATRPSMPLVATAR